MRANIYRENVRQADRCTISTELWLFAFLAIAMLGLAGACLLIEEDPCDPANEGTDYWYEVCLNEGPIDLSPIEDEAQEAISQERRP